MSNSLRLGFAVTGLVAGLSGTIHAAAAVYDFSTMTAGTVPTANQYPAPAGTVFQGSYTQGATSTTPTGVGVIGPDNWVWTSQATNVFPSIIRNDPPQLAGSGNYASAYPTIANSATGSGPPGYDTINTRVNNSTFGYHAANAPFSVSFVATITAVNYTVGTTTPVATTNTSRSEMALGFDQNNDGDIRGNASTSENAEVGPIFGFESVSAAGSAGLTGRWYLRGAAFATVGASNQVNATGPGTYLIQLDIDPTTNPNAGSATIYAGNDGSGTLSVKQLFDASGAPSTGAAAVLTPVISNLNLGLTAMNNHSGSNVGTANGSNPAYWNGILTRLAQNGTIDDITITPEPASLLSLGAASMLLRRRRRA